MATGDMEDWVQSQVDTGAYANTSDYVRDLIRQDQDYRNKIQTLQAAVNIGLESGVSSKSFDEIIEDVRNEVKGK
jgi:antitoxin ParD1/3/4